MKKLVLPLLLLLGISMLLAQAVSEPSEVVGYVKYNCLPGGNLVAVPMSSSATFVSELIASYNLNDEIDYVSFWNNDASVQNWEATMNQGGNYFDPDPVVEPGACVYISFIGSTPFDFYSIGSLPTTNAQYTIKTDGNVVMIPLNRPDVSYISTLAMEIAPEECDYLSLWNNDASVQNWEATMNQGGDYFDPDPELTIGMPVFVNYMGTTDVVWPAGPRGIGSALRSRN